tara:strand:- start:357 stop:1547 length:1191 start_codon:yes stop_codon:yes gene_type:complete
MAVPEAFYREAIDLNRYSNKVQFQIASQFNEVILDVLRKIRDLEGNSPATTARLRSILAQMVESLKGWENESAAYMIAELQGLAEFQVGFVEDQLKRVLPKGEVQVNTVAVSPDFAKSVVTKDPTALTIRLRGEDGVFRASQFALTAKRGSDISLPNGKTVQKAFRGIAEDSGSRLSKAIRLGVLEGESLPQIVRRLKGPNLSFASKPQNAIALNSALKNSEGMLLSNKQIQTVVRTSVNQVQNAASQAVYAANKNVTGKYQYVATLDARTSSICQRLDGQIFNYEKGPVPPQHFNCRSTTVPIIEDFDFPPSALETRPSATGRVPQNTNYANWLKDNPSIQDEVLGKKKRYFNFLMSSKRGKKQLNATNALKKIIREDGTELTLEQLAKKYPNAN